MQWRRQPGSRRRLLALVEAVPFGYCFSLLRRFTRSWRSGLLAVGALSLVVLAVGSPLVSAKTADKMTPKEQALSWSYAQVLAYCSS
ncbi:MAG TPA: hypothetical protein PKD68_05440, partial [Candidatus Saccharibacteria bacterium]|nr:hypothetical protein [Candidatus Saccharibacteria bacterium]